MLDLTPDTACLVFLIVLAVVASAIGLIVWRSLCHWLDFGRFH